MKRKFFKNIEWGILICTVILIVIGLVALYSATYGSTSDEFKKQIINRLASGDTNGVNSFLELFTSELISQKLEPDKVKNYFFELIVTAINGT